MKMIFVLYRKSCYLTSGFLFKELKGMQSMVIWMGEEITTVTLQTELEEKDYKLSEDTRMSGYQILD